MGPVGPIEADRRLTKRPRSSYNGDKSATIEGGFGATAVFPGAGRVVPRPFEAAGLRTGRAEFR
ncbi:hypothetical protein TR75_09330 [Hydrogenibacillus schlegelii]|uniref:Uncharacterized protein n=1 Tax=Hydrogenibacillus schlegelii TaxID=1484 RepID=A0A132MHM7_HYDSH|nr:hypothetical protein TR75_09330 [Hydrogenibacillus schlegelii]OAR03721.1 hypothetical protein SA87_00610 [Hydrogenibacillus schlegelii]